MLTRQNCCSVYWLCSQVTTVITSTDCVHKSQLSLYQLTMFISRYCCSVNLLCMQVTTVDLSTDCVHKSRLNAFTLSVIWKEEKSLIPLSNRAWNWGEDCSFLVACYATPYPALLVCRLVTRSVSRSVSWSVGPLFTFLALLLFWAYNSCPNTIISHFRSF